MMRGSVLGLTRARTAAAHEREQALAHWHRRPRTDRRFTAGLVLYFRIAPTHEAARRDAIEYLSREYRQPFEGLVDRYCALGPVSECRAAVERFMEAGVEHFDLIPMCTPDLVMDQLRELAAELSPLVDGDEGGSHLR